MTGSPSFSLHIPVPPARPGEAAHFDYLNIPEPGETPRPDSAATAATMRDLAYGMIRVLDSEGQPVGDWAPDIDPERLRAGLRAMLMTRQFEERMFRAHRQGKTSFFMKSTGEEAIGAAQSMVLGPRDMCFPTYRVLSWLMARDYPLSDLVNQIFSNEKDPLKGRQLPVLYSARDFCCRWTVEDAIRAGFRARLLWDLCRSVNPEGDAALRRDLERMGVVVLDGVPA